MGFGSFFAGLAADAAREYANRRGLEGMIEDAGNLKNKVSGFFSGTNDEDDYEEYSQESSGNFWDILDGYIEEEDFDGAQSFINEYVGQGNKDDFFYYAMAYLYNIKAVTDDSIEDERKAKNYISNAVNNLNGDSDWRNSVYELKRKIDANLRLFKKENEQTKQFQKEWEQLTKCFDLDNPCPATDAVTALETFYDNHNLERDIMYHFYLYRAYEKLILVEEDPLDNWYDRMKEEVAIVTALARNNPQENGSFAATIQKSFIFWENMKLGDEIHALVEAGNLTKAFELAKKLKDDEALITRVMTRLESLSLLEMVTTCKPSKQEVQRKIWEVEDVMRRACKLEEDPETSAKIREAAEERIAVAKQYLDGKDVSLSASNQSKGNPVSTEEEEYLEELKACYEDGVITDKERRILNRLRKSLGISESRAAELEAMCQPKTLTQEEQEYADEVKACLEDDGKITPKERRLLERLAKSLNISPQRAAEIEKMVQ